MDAIVPRRELARPRSTILGIVVALVVTALVATPVRPALATSHGPNGMLVYETGAPGHLIWAVCHDGGSDAVLLGTGAAPAVSPDGTRIAYRGVSGGNYNGIWVMNADGSNPVQLTTDTSDSTPAWSPDGITLAAQRRITYPDVASHLQPILINVFNGQVTQLLNDPAYRLQQSVAWSPNGQWVYFPAANIPPGTTFREGNDLYRVSSSGGTPQLLLEGMAVFSYGHPTMHPEGTGFAVTRQRLLLPGQLPEESELDQLDVQMDGGGATVLWTGQAFNTDTVRTISSFSPDGSMAALYRFERSQSPQRFAEITNLDHDVLRTVPMGGSGLFLQWTTMPTGGCGSPGPTPPPDSHIELQVDEVMLAAGGNRNAQYVELSDPGAGDLLEEDLPYQLRVYDRVGTLLGVHTIDPALLEALAAEDALLIGTAAADAALGSTRAQTLGVGLPAIGQICITYGPSTTTLNCVTWGCDVSPVASPQTIPIAYPTATLSAQRQGTATSEFRLSVPTPGTTNLTGQPGGTCPVTPVEASTLTDDARGEVTAPSQATAGGEITVTVGDEHAGDEVSVWLHSTPIDLGWHTVGTTGTVTVPVPGDVPAGDHRVVVYAADGELLGWDDVAVLAATTTPVVTTPGGPTDPTEVTQPAADELPETGASSGTLAALAIGLLGLGALLIRRRTGAPTHARTSTGA